MIFAKFTYWHGAAEKPTSRPFLVRPEQVVSISGGEFRRGHDWIAGTGIEYAPPGSRETKTVCVEQDVEEVVRMLGISPYMAEQL